MTALQELRCIYDGRHTQEARHVLSGLTDEVG